MTIHDLGYADQLESYRNEQGLGGFEVGRISSEHKDRYTLKTPEQEYQAELIGNLRFAAESRYDLPAVGDWVAFTAYDEDKALIHAIFPRQSVIERQAVGKTGQVQIIATNIDYGIIMQAVDRDFNINRLERYLSICHASKVAPLILISKVDLIGEGELATILEEVGKRIKEAPILAVSNQPEGYAKLRGFIEAGKTYCLLGSSGVGKSTLINHLAGREQMKTKEINTEIGRGRHTTTHRELIVLEGGGILIDNPGMREVGITDLGGGLEVTFDAIFALAEKCRFKDCTHTHENGCAVLAALDNGELEEEAYANFRKMEKEKQHFETSVQERRRRDKSLGKMYKEIQKQRKKNKY